VGEVRRFEDLIAWQKARALTREVYRVTATGRFARDFRLCSQLQAASVSVMANIAEGFERRGPKEYLYHLNIAKGSCGEARAELYVALDAGYVAQEDFDRLREQAEELSRVITGLAASVARAHAP
jgi:four helix bundle protein